jgi:hypothetical protein
VVLILFVLDLKIYLNDLENLFVKKKEKGEELTCCWWPGKPPDRPVSLSREWAELSRAFPFFPRSVGQPKAQL